MFVFVRLIMLTNSKIFYCINWILLWKTEMTNFTDVEWEDIKKKIIIISICSYRVVGVNKKKTKNCLNCATDTHNCDDKTDTQKKLKIIYLFNNKPHIGAQ